MAAISVRQDRQLDAAKVLSKAVLNSAKLLGLSQQELGEVVGRDRSSIQRGLEPSSKPGELALLLIRCYRALNVLVGESEAEMRHWFATFNHHTGGIPKQQVKQVPGLIRVLNYLDAMRGKI
ncbi:MAG: MbcA/ParS/Xre antitoxin family protein [Gammaproteobacteria bacterium]|nr:MbcA/ParS/Xre antitoxin family protein [Gammaproteobacteria bacterium]